MKCNQPRLVFELVSLYPFHTTITITPRARSKRHHPPKQNWSITIRFFSIISRTFVGGVVLPLCRGAVGVLNGTLVGGVLPLWSDVVDVFYIPGELGHRALVRGVLPVRSDAVGVFYSASWLGHKTLVGRVLLLWILQSQPTGLLQEVWLESSETCV